MISNQSVEDFKAICGGIQAKAVGVVQERCLKAVGDANARGMLRSSVAALQMDRIAADTFNTSAEQVYAALKVLNDSEPTANPIARRQQLLALLESQMRELGDVVFAARMQYRRTCAQGLQNSSLLDDAPSLAVIDRAVTEYKGHLGLAVTTLGNADARQSTPSVLIHNNAPTGAIVVGNGNTANVTQSVVTQVSPGEVKAALDALIQALQQAQGLAPDQRVEVVEVLEQVKGEADKEKPNRLKLGGLIGGVADAIQGVAAAPASWAVVLAWYEGLKAVLT